MIPLLRRARRQKDAPEEERRDLEERVRELDQRLDACFLGEIAPALERARLARETR